MSVILYHGNSIIVRHLLPDDMVLLHEWLKMPDFSLYRPCLGDMCPNVLDLVDRLISVRQLTPALEIEVLIEHRATQTPIGVMSLSGIDHFNLKAEFSMGFVRGQGTRCTMEALHFGLEQAFSVLNLRKVIFYITAGNKRAQQFMTHYGMTEEGLLREELLLSSGETLDIHRYALLRSDWERGELRKALTRLVPLVL